jgi:agmatine deiminase
MWWPAEYGAHEGCILLFPHESEQTTYQTATLLQNVQATVLDVISAIVQQGKEHVFLFCHDETHQELVIRMLKERNLPYVIASSSDGSMGPDAEPKGDDDFHVLLFLCPSNDTWARDTGPSFCFRKTVLSTARSDLVGLDWDFNAYGGEEDGCYFPYSLDQRVSSNMIEQINKYFSASFSTSTILHEPIPSLVLEGGSIHTDGEGTILTTKECLLHPNRNPDKTQEEIERIILQATGCEKMIWLDAGLAHDDDTNGHIDNWACFAKPGHVVLAWTDDVENDPVNYRNCRDAYATLESATDAKGRSLVLHKIYLPSPLYFSDDGDVDGNIPAEITTTVTRVMGTRMAASYANFYIANHAVIVPQFQDPMYDGKAVEVLQSLFPERIVVGINNSRNILYGGGNVHCITQQVPKFTGL